MIEKIKQQLQSLFDGYAREIVFWYDDLGEYASLMEELEMDGVIIHHLTKKDAIGRDGTISSHYTNQFHTKWLLEREDTTSNYLIYADFPKPPIIENHLEDTLGYSKRFYADRSSMVAKELELSENNVYLVRKYQKFFASSQRLEALKKYQMDFNTNLALCAISVVCKVKSPQFDEILRTLLCEDLMENKYLEQLEKLELHHYFWDLCRDILGFEMESPTLRKLVYSLFLTAMHKEMGTAPQKVLEQYISQKGNSMVAFLDYVMCYHGFESRFRGLSSMVYEDLLADRGYFQATLPELCVNLEIFPQVDEFLLSWMVSQLESEQIGATLSGMTMEELCRLRLKMHFGRNSFHNQYLAIYYGIFLLKAEHFQADFTAEDIFHQYVKSDFMYDQYYREFYTYYDQISDSTPYETLRLLVENTYTNCFLNPLSVAWTKSFAQESFKHSSEQSLALKKQIHFYQDWVKPIKERVVVIISDALRYEVAVSLLKKLESDEKCEPKLSAILGVLPSYTRLGMSALLPYSKLELTEQGEILVNGKERYDLESRQLCLQEENPNSVAIRYEKLEQMTSSERKEFSTGKEVIYVYHDQIDNTGDDLRSEHQVFQACEQAIEQIHGCIRKMSSANNTKFIVTADHGFLYKRDTLAESDKISDYEKNGVHIARRYLISEEKVETEGVVSLSLGKMLDNEDSRRVTAPMGSDIFKKQGAGQNFVHGGASLQELVLPVLEIKTKKGKQETKVVTITVVNMPKKITNLTTKVHFIQNEPVSDVNKQASYRLSFQDGEGNILCKEMRYVADSAVIDSSKRGFSLSFHLKNQLYPKNKNYYFVILEEENDLEVFREEIPIDLAFTDDYGF